MRHITWENFKKNFIEPGTAGAHPVPGSPPCQLFVDRDGCRIGLRIAIKDASTIVELPYQHIEVSTVHINGVMYAQVTCEIVALHEPFFAMITSAADLIQEFGRSPMEALQESAQKFFNLLSSHSLLSPEKQVGLWCELWLLQRLVATKGGDVVESWIGSLKEPHDFRFSNTEIEVKGTRRTKRTHLISSEEQLRPSDGCELYLLSLQLEPSGGEGCESLTGMVTVVREMLSDDASNLERVRILLEKARYFDAHAGFYTQKYKLRKTPVLVPVEDGIPRITMEMLSAFLDNDACRRVSEVKYRLDLTDLGYEEKEEEFQQVLRTLA